MEPLASCIEGYGEEIVPLNQVHKLPSAEPRSCRGRIGEADRVDGRAKSVQDGGLEDAASGPRAAAQPAPP